MANGNATLAALGAAHGQLPRTAEVATGGGGRHLYFRAPCGLRSGVLGPGLDLKAESGYVVAPPSRHQSGQGYGWIVPLPGTLDELPSIPDWLVTEFVTPLTGEDAAEVARAAPIDRTSFPCWLPTRLVVGTRHRMLVRLAGWVRGCGYGEDAILAELRTVVTSRVAQPPGDPIADEWLTKLAYSMAQKPLARFPLRARYAPLAVTWKGRAGRTDRHVLFRAVLPIVARYRRLYGAHEAVPVPSLTVANMADVSDRTASRSLRRLRQVRRVLDYAGPRTRVDAARRYRLRPPRIAGSHSDEGHLATPAVRSTALGQYAKIPDFDLYREIFLPRGFGPAAEDMFKVLAVDVGQPVATLCRAANCHISTAYRVLDRMASHGLAVRKADGWRRETLSRARLTEIAVTLGVHGKIAAETARRRAQRLVYHARASQRRRERDAAIRRDVQKRLLALATTRGWPRIGDVVGERSWRVHVRRTRTRGLWSLLRVLTRGVKHASATRTTVMERCGGRRARGGAS